MHRFLFFLCGIFLAATLLTPVKAQSTHQTKNNSLLAAAGKWFAAWEFISREFYRINSVKSVEFVFFDDKFVYSTSELSAPNGETIDGPSLFDKKLTWKRALHKGQLKLPDGKILPVGLMSFAAPLKTHNAFFVMPLPEFWGAAGVSSKELGLENLVTGVFLHEFSHTQQVQNFGKQMSEFERAYKFDTDFNDDIVQDYYQKDARYTSQFREETALFYAAFSENNKAKSNDSLARAFEKYHRRQNEFFIGDKKHFREIDDFFLTMEGFGQFSMYLWLTAPRGGNINPEMALAGIRRGGKYWSQDEGFALFLVLSKFIKPASWAKLLMGKDVVSIIELITKEQNKLSK